MYSFNFRHLYNLRGQKIAFCLFFTLFFLDTSAQYIKNTRQHLDNYDAKDVHFGFFFAPSSTRFNTKFNQDFVSSNLSYLINSPESFSLRMGGLVNFKLDDYWDFRILPTINLYNRQVNFYENTTGKLTKYRSETTWFEVPAVIKYKSERRENYRMYMFAGARVGIEGRSRKKVSNFEKLNVKQSDFSLEYGIGAERFFEFFKFSPELHFSHGLTNVYVPINNTTNLGTGIDKFTSHAVSLYLFFE